MALTSRGRSLVAVAAVLVVIAIAVGVVVLGGKGDGSQAQGNPAGNPQGSSSPSPILRICPLTGVQAHGGAVPNRPALAVKVENLPAARPQTGLSFADVIYEEPVEAGITRFIVVYQCEDASRIEPIRSGRLTDPPVLVQFGKPVFGYAGGVPAVIKAVRAAGLTDVNFNNAPRAYHRDSARVAPHNLYSSSRELYAAAKRTGGIPQPVFTYSPDVPVTASAASSVHVPFSQNSDVYWRWSGSRSAWMRSYGTVPATYSDGRQMASPNVVIQMVRIRMTDITDVNGVRSPEVISTGSGTCFVLRDGKMIKGRWSRPTTSDVTVFKDAQSNVIPLTPGKTWVELVPNTVHVTVG
jgi:hypothetical protein